MCASASLGISIQKNIQTLRWRSQTTVLASFSSHLPPPEELEFTALVTAAREEM
jgi:hypothetical protein